MRSVCSCDALVEIPNADIGWRCAESEVHIVVDPKQIRSQRGFVHDSYSLEHEVA